MQNFLYVIFQCSQTPPQSPGSHSLNGTLSKCYVWPTSHFTYTGVEVIIPIKPVQDRKSLPGSHLCRTISWNYYWTKKNTVLVRVQSGKKNIYLYISSRFNPRSVVWNNGEGREVTVRIGDAIKKLQKCKKSMPNFHPQSRTWPLEFGFEEAFHCHHSRSLSCCTIAG